MKIMAPKMLRAVVCTAAERPPLIIPNVYYGDQLIGVGIRLRGHRYLSVQWARPVAPVPCSYDVGDPPDSCRCLLARGHDGLHECIHHQTDGDER